MSERFKIHNFRPADRRRKEDPTWAVYDDDGGDWLVSNLTESQAETVKRTLNEAIGKEGKNGR